MKPTRAFAIKPFEVIVEERIREALNGSRRIHVTLKANSEAIEKLRWLCLTAALKHVQMEFATLQTLEHVRQRGCWTHEEERTIVLVLGDRFDPDDFQEHMTPVMENIIVLTS